MNRLLGAIRAVATAAANSSTGSFANVPQEVQAAWTTFIDIFLNHDVPKSVLDRDALGRLVRDVWVRFAQQQPNPKSSWLQPWDELTDDEREVDRQIGETLGAYTLAMTTAALVYLSDDQRTHLRDLVMQVERVVDST